MGPGPEAARSGAGLNPLVSVITPTWQRHDLLLGRCIPSVAAQTYRPLEHVVVSDGPDEDLSCRIGWPQSEGLTGRFDQLPGREPGQHWGGPARRRGIELARGDLIAYLDDDDAYRPDHVALLAAALGEHPEAGFAWSQMLCHQPHGDEVIGGPLCSGGVGTPMLMHRREILTAATSRPACADEDWQLVAEWLEAGIADVVVPVITVDVWPGGGH